MDYPTNKLNIVIQQGATFTMQLDIKAEDGEPIVDIETADLRGQIRTSYAASAATAAFTFTWLDNFGKSTMTMSATTTTTVPAAEYVYDVELYFPTGVVWRIIEGKAKVTPEATK